MLYAPFHILELRVPYGKFQRDEFDYLLWNVPIQIFAICCIISEVYKGFRYRKGWHSTLEKKLGYILGFHLYQKITTWLEALLSLSVNMVQVSTYILWKFKTINVRNENKVQVRPLTVKIKN